MTDSLAHTTVTSSQTASDIVAGLHERFCADQLVVSLPYAADVAHRLQSLGAAPSRDPEPNERLGLALVTFDAHAALAHLDPATASLVRDAHDTVTSGDPSDLQLVLQALRAMFVSDHAGWCPTLGKNRIVDGVDPEHAIEYEDLGELRRVAAGQGFPVRPRRPGHRARVGLVDTAIADHPYLAGGVLAEGPDVVRDGAAPGTRHAHATFLAGLLLREAPGASVELVQAEMGEGSRDSWTLARQIVAMSDAGVDIINLSLGCFTDDGRPPLVLERAVAALGRSTLIVAAAGNYRPQIATSPPPCWPGALDGVLAVGALDRDVRAPFSPEAPWVDAMAQGVDITSLLVDEQGPGWGQWEGTSFSAALVSGAIAARVVPGRTDSRAAWASLAADSKQDEAGRPMVGSLPALSGWPQDGTEPLGGAS